jgi:hypothetical protein
MQQAVLVEVFEAVAFHLALRVLLVILMTMFIRRLQNLSILNLLIISLLINPVVTSGYGWCVAADNHSLQEEAIARDCASDNYVENAAYRWGNFSPRQGNQPGSLLASILPTTAIAPVPSPERNLNTLRVVDTSPRIPDQILHHRTIVLLI